MPRNPYVADGLVAWWDGLWNAGLGVHDDAATVWRDLMGTYTMTESASTDTWGDAYLNMGTTTWDVTPKQQLVHLINSPQRVGEGYSIEMILSHTGQGNKLIFGQAYPSLDIHALRVREQAWVKSGTNIDIGPTGGGLHSISISSARAGSTGNQSQRWHYNGANAQSATRAFVSMPDTDSRAIGIGHGEYPARGIATARIYCIRLYSRVLTDAEVAANYAVDKERFGLP